MNPNPSSHSPAPERPLPPRPSRLMIWEARLKKLARWAMALVAVLLVLCAAMIIPACWQARPASVLLLVFGALILPAFFVWFVAELLHGVVTRVRRLAARVRRLAANPSEESAKITQFLSNPGKLAIIFFLVAAPFALLVGSIVKSNGFQENWFLEDWFLLGMVSFLVFGISSLLYTCLALKLLDGIVRFIIAPLARFVGKLSIRNGRLAINFLDRLARMFRHPAFPAIIPVLAAAVIALGGHRPRKTEDFAIILVFFASRSAILFGCGWLPGCRGG